MFCPLGGGEDFWCIVVRPSSQHQRCSLRLPRVSVVSLLFRASCDLRGDMESVYGALLATTCLSLDQDRGSSFLSAGVPSSVIHGQRPRCGIQVLAGRQTGSACVNVVSLFDPPHVSSHNWCAPVIIGHVQKSEKV